MGSGGGIKVPNIAKEIRDLGRGTRRWLNDQRNTVLADVGTLGVNFVERQQNKRRKGGQAANRESAIADAKVAEVKQQVADDRSKRASIARRTLNRRVNYAQGTILGGSTGGKTLLGG